MTTKQILPASDRHAVPRHGIQGLCAVILDSGSESGMTTKTDA